MGAASLARVRTKMTTMVTILGTAALPNPVMVSATTPGTAASGVVPRGYEGMRVQVTGGPFTVKESEASLTTCPTALEYTATGD